MFVSRIVKVGLDLVLCVANLLGCYSKIPTCKQYLKATLIRHFNSVEYAFVEFDVPELTVFSIVGNVK